MKVYICKCTDAPMFGDEVSVSGVFLYKEHAEKYCEIQQALEEPYTYSYYVDEMEVQEDYDMSLTVEEFYCFTCTTENKTEEEIEENWYNDPEEKYKKVYTSDLIEEVTDYGDDKHIEVYSINSFEEAKQRALELWRELNESK